MFGQECGTHNYDNIGPEIKLFQGLQWTLWETIEYDTRKKYDSDAWDKCIRKVAWFDNVINFHQAWNRVPHAKIAEILFDGVHFK